MDVPGIPAGQCVKGAVYELRSRNLAAGVYDGADGFIGIREKFFNRYLDVEYHYEHSDRYGTAWPLREMGRIDPGISLALTTGTVCQQCRQPVEYSRTSSTQGAWRHAEPAGAGHDPWPVSVGNTDLHDAILPFEEQARRQRAADQTRGTADLP